MTMSQREVEQARYNARDRDFIASLPYGCSIEPMMLKSGKWRAYIRYFVTPATPRGQEAESKEAVRDGYDNIITANSRDELILKLRQEYPGWKWDKVNSAQS